MKSIPGYAKNPVSSTQYKVKTEHHGFHHLVLTGYFVPGTGASKGGASC